MTLNQLVAAFIVLGFRKKTAARDRFTVYKHPDYYQRLFIFKHFIIFGHHKTKDLHDLQNFYKKIIKEIQNNSLT